MTNRPIWAVFRLSACWTSGPLESQVENNSARVKKIAAAATNQNAILGCVTDEDMESLSSRG